MPALVDNQTTPEIILFERYSYHCKIPNATPKELRGAKAPPNTLPIFGYAGELPALKK
jgi:hypothetical protein